MYEQETFLIGFDEHIQSADENCEDFHNSINECLEGESERNHRVAEIVNQNYNSLDFLLNKGT